MDGFIEDILAGWTDKWMNEWMNELVY